MDKIKSLYQCFLDGGIPPEEIDHHYSDLYVKVSFKSQKILEEFQKNTGTRCFAQIFKANDGSGLWYDIAFAYDPFWMAAAKKGREIYGGLAS